MKDHQTNISLKAQDIAIAYLLLRIFIGVNYFNHGFTRIFDIPGFAEGIVEQLQDSYFPPFLVRINSYLVPPVELIVGILITIGLATRSAIIATFILMIILKMGVTSVQNWGAATSMISYSLVLFILLAGHSFDIYSIDHWRKKSKTSTNSATPTEQSTNQFRLLFHKLTKKRRKQHRSYLR